jgi:hypothetical protein
MTPLLLAIILLIAAVVTVILGLPFLAVALFVFAVLAFTWSIVVFARGGRVVPEGHRTEKPELLGPGGPDDPDR